MPVSAAALARKARSIAILRGEGVPVIDHLPTIEDEASAVSRTSAELAIRALALLVVSAKGAVRNAQLARDLVARFPVAEDLSPKERAFMDDPVPAPQTSLNFSWRYESLNVLLWALGYVEALQRPDRLVDTDTLIPILMRRPRELFLAAARPRPMVELLDADDLIYRYHWATTEARLKRQPMPAGLHASVVYERHYALNWLVAGADWDKVDTST